MSPRSSGAPIERLESAAYRVPTESPESDGTYAWDSTTLVVVHARAAGVTGFGYTYGTSAIVPLIRDHLARVVVGRDAFAVEGTWNALVGEVRNVGRPGIASMAISAVDAALWDLKARLLGLPLVTLLGEVREAVPAYGSGGFTSYSVQALCRELVAFEEMGLERVKMKVGTRPSDDVERVEAARDALLPSTTLMVDANGAYGAAEALGKARHFADAGVDWFEEPVVADDVDGLRFVRDRAPPGMDVAAGEYGDVVAYFRRLLERRAVGVLQADATRCLGITGFLAVARLAQAFGVPLSSHTAPSIHVHPACAATAVVHMEYFHDHVRIEELLFDGFRPVVGGALRPDRTRPGIGVTLKRSDAERYAVSPS